MVLSEPYETWVQIITLHGLFVGGGAREYTFNVHMKVSLAIYWDSIAKWFFFLNEPWIQEHRGLKKDYSSFCLYVVG